MRVNTSLSRRPDSSGLERELPTPITMSADQCNCPEHKQARYSWLRHACTNVSHLYRERVQAPKTNEVSKLSSNRAVEHDRGNRVWRILRDPRRAELPVND
jgi:hypothetical protein